MDGYEFASSLVEHLAWPSVVVFVLVTQKPSVSVLLDRLKKLKWGDKEAEFGDEVKDTLKQASSLSARPVETPTPVVISGGGNLPPLTVHSTMRAIPPATWRPPITPKHRDERLRASGLIIEEWANLEESIRILAITHGNDKAETEVVSPLLDRLASQKVLSQETVNLIQELRTLRNRVAHSQFEPTREAGEDYAATCWKVEQRIAEEEMAWQREFRKLSGDGEEAAESIR